MLFDYRMDVKDLEMSDNDKDYSYRLEKNIKKTFQVILSILTEMSFWLAFLIFLFLLLYLLNILFK